ncbi:MAG: UDP-N-acetylglucosamine 2-epimerase (non-hydrolyzing) [Acidobacteria bacterium]|nr:UDP-N-acetylglucosamine 2-epimerase (non-hydrolyzing) [Acidobacteriota bacterium]
MATRKIKLAVVFGTRPEAIKLVPVLQQLSSDTQFQPVSIVTAQHREMLDQVLDTFHIRPKHDLGIMAPNQTLAGIVSQSVERLDQLFKKIQPNGVVVQGDTATTFVASLAAFYNHIPVGHVEAGLRTGDRGELFPEEMNRRLTSALAEWHFTPTTLARENLLAEGVAPASVFVTGNTVIDAFHLALKVRRNGEALIEPEELAGKRLILVTMHRRENQGAPTGKSGEPAGWKACPTMLRLRTQIAVSEEWEGCCLQSVFSARPRLCGYQNCELGMRTTSFSGSHSHQAVCIFQLSRMRQRSDGCPLRPRPALRLGTSSAR